MQHRLIQQDSGSVQPLANPWSAETLGEINRGFHDQDPETILAWGLASFGRDLCLATSFGPQSIVLMHMIPRLRPGTTVFYLDTSLLFPETYALRDELSRRLGMRFVRVASDLSLAQQQAEHGPELWSHDPRRCCYLRKVLPLRRFLADKRAWVTGLRRGTSRHRATAELVEWDEANGLVKLNPLVAWPDARVRNYLHEHDLPYNPLHDKGYTSVGCRPCTRAVLPGEDVRAGRWAGFAKTECGIHVSGPLQLGDSGVS